MFGSLFLDVPHLDCLIFGSCCQIFTIRTEANRPNVEISILGILIGKRAGDELLFGKENQDALPYTVSYCEALPYFGTRIDIVNLRTSITASSQVAPILAESDTTDNTVVFFGVLKIDSDRFCNSGVVADNPIILSDTILFVECFFPSAFRRGAGHRNNRLETSNELPTDHNQRRGQVRYSALSSPLLDFSIVGEVECVLSLDDVRLFGSIVVGLCT